ncbi:hypothetical protein NDU88_005700 [Pleurodeles waltl]|uniref:Uncharacterized protein n=1 Tax=Pleurodeles waltl TaxID=8319 RepID=A0AAV7QM09_PLEWA|nr:hypothetical protein NDU88_005700 [Pleurodeles waltl]
MSWLLPGHLCNDSEKGMPARSKVCLRRLRRRVRPLRAFNGTAAWGPYNSGRGARLHCGALEKLCVFAVQENLETRQFRVAVRDLCVYPRAPVLAKQETRFLQESTASVRRSTLTALQKQSLDQSRRLGISVELITLIKMPTLPLL